MALAVALLAHRACDIGAHVAGAYERDADIGAAEFDAQRFREPDDAQPGTTPDKAGVRVLYKRLRDAFPDFRPEIHWQTVDNDIVTTFKTYHGTQLGDFLGIAPTGKAIQFETVDAMRVRDGKITDHWGVANLYSVLQQLGQLPT
jgi:predicted ester cyclase